MPIPITIAGWDLYPESVNPNPKLIGGPTRESINGTGYRRITGQKQVVSLVWGYLDAEEFQLIQIVWALARAGTVAIACVDPRISGTFLLVDQVFPFTYIEGSTEAYKGSLTFQEQ